MNSSNNGFIHSTPVPEFFKLCSKVLAEYINFKGKIQKLIYETLKSKREREKQKICSFLLKLEPQLPVIKKIVDEVELLKNNERLTAQLAYAIVGDLVLSGGSSHRLTSSSKPVVAVMAVDKQILAIYDSNDLEQFQPLPRWARVNTLLASESEVVVQLEEEGWFEMKVEPDLSYDDFLYKIQTLSSYQFMRDYHVPGLYVFPAKSPLSQSDLFKDGKIVLQDKASCLPPLVSGVQPGMSVVDACAAPGNKTIQIAGLMKNKGSLLVVERDGARFSLLKQRLSAHGARRVQLQQADFSSVPLDQLSGVHTAILDPSCSNSGVAMFTNDESMCDARVERLACMQYKLLSHALNIPGIQAVVYSTCSQHRKENEGVVEGILHSHGHKFELEDLGKTVKQWKHFGTEDFIFRSKVLRTKSSIDKCHGFFVAKFVAKQVTETLELDSTEDYTFQDENNVYDDQNLNNIDETATKIENGDIESTEENTSSLEPKHKKRKQDFEDLTTEKDIEELELETEEHKKKSRKDKKHKKKSVSNLAEETNIEELELETEERKKKSRKDKKHKKTSVSNFEQETQLEIDSEDPKHKKKSKKDKEHKKKSVSNFEEETNIEEKLELEIDSTETKHKKKKSKEIESFELSPENNIIKYETNKLEKTVQSHFEDETNVENELESKLKKKKRNQDEKVNLSESKIVNKKRKSEIEDDIESESNHKEKYNKEMEVFETSSLESKRKKKKHDRNLEISNSETEDIESKRVKEKNLKIEI